MITNIWENPLVIDSQNLPKTSPTLTLKEEKDKVDQVLYHTQEHPDLPCGENYIIYIQWENKTYPCRIVMSKPNQIGVSLNGKILTFESEIAQQIIHPTNIKTASDEEQLTHTKNYARINDKIYAIFDKLENVLINKTSYNQKIKTDYTKTWTEKAIDFLQNDALEPCDILFEELHDIFANICNMKDIEGQTKLKIIFTSKYTRLLYAFLKSLKK